MLTNGLERGFTPEELSEFGQSFRNEWSPKDKKAHPNFSQSFSGGGTFGNLGTVFSLTYGRKFQRRRETVNSYNELNGELVPYNSFVNDKNSESVKWGLVGNLSYWANNRLDRNAYRERDLSRGQSADEHATA